MQATIDMSKTQKRPLYQGIFESPNAAKHTKSNGMFDW